MHQLIGFLSDPQVQSILSSTIISCGPPIVKKIWGKVREVPVEEQLRNQLVDCFKAAWKDTAKYKNWPGDKTVADRFIEELKNINCINNSDVIRQIFQKVTSQEIVDADIEYFEEKFCLHSCKPEHELLWKNHVRRFFENKNKSSVPMSPEYTLTPNAPRWDKQLIFGRKDFVDVLCKELQNDTPPIQLTGMGGIGKTEILNKIYEYFIKKKENINRYFNHIALLHYVDSIDSSLTTQITCLAGKNIDDAWTYMQNLCSATSVLFLIDDKREKNQNSIQEDESFKKLFTLRATVLFASRTLFDGEYFKAIPVTPLHIEDCVQIFQAQRYLGKPAPTLTKDERSIIEDMIDKRAGCSAFIVRRFGVLAQAGLTRLAKKLTEENFVSKGINDEESQREINKLYQLKDIKTEAAQNLLEAFALFPDIPLSQSVCVQWLQKDANIDEDQCSHTLNDLSKSTWLMEHIQEGGRETSYSMHQLVKVAVTAQTTITFDNHRKLLSHLLEAISWDNTDTFVKTKPYIDYAVSLSQYFYNGQHVVNTDFAILMSWIGRHYEDIADYPKALEWYNKALTITEKVLGKEHPDTATTYNNIACIYDSQGDYILALEWYMKALTICERVLGKDHPNTAITYSNIANSYFSQGNYVEALEMYGKALAIFERVLSKEHPSTAVIQKNYEACLQQCNC
jgi:tetratricopeptide (TPR) repeat protein